MSNVLRLAVWFLGTFFSICGVTQAEQTLPPSFEAVVSTSALIVVGDLNGKGDLSIAAVLKGSNPGTLPLKLEGGEQYFRTLTAGERNPEGNGAQGFNRLRVVAFLNASPPMSRAKSKPLRSENTRWRLNWGWSGLVGITPNGVYIFDSKRFEAGAKYELTTIAYSYYPSPTYTPTSFLRMINESIHVFAKRDELVARPRTQTKIHQLVELLSHQDSYYYWGSTAQFFEPLQPFEEKNLLDELKKESRPGAGYSEKKQVKFLSFLTSLKPSKGSYATVLAFTDLAYSSPVRRTAITCLSTIDQDRASADFVSKLSIDNPEIGTMLSCLRPLPSNDPVNPVNVKAKTALGLISQQLRTRSEHGVQQPNLFAPLARETDSKSAKIFQLQNYASVPLIEELHTWTLDDRNDGAQQAKAALSLLTGLDFKKGEGVWAHWWPKAQPLLTPTYDLKTEKGLHQWLDAYALADEATRRILMRLWFNQKTVDEISLLRAASQDGGRANAAKAVLSQLWEAGSLSAESRHSIVRQFVTLRLVQDKDYWQKYNIYSFRVIADRQFPFPKKPEFQYGASIALGNEKFSAGQPHNARGLEGQESIVVGTRSGGSLEGPRFVRAQFVLREPNYYAPRNAQKIWWTQRWRLPAIPLLPEMSK
jgi:hypothetical protein